MFSIINQRLKIHCSFEKKIHCLNCNVIILRFLNFDNNFKNMIYIFIKCFNFLSIFVSLSLKEQHQNEAYNTKTW